MAHSVLMVRKDKSIITAINPQVTLIDSLAYRNVKEGKVIDFYKNIASFEMKNYIITPISFTKAGESWNMIYHSFGTSLASQNSQQLQDFGSPELIKTFSQLYYHLKQLKPKVSLQNIFQMDKQPFKILFTDCWQTSKEYIDAYHETMKKISKKGKYFDQRLQKMNDIQALKEFFSDKKEGKPLSKILELKFNPKLQPYKINIEQAEIDWIFTSLGFLSAPKYQLIYNGVQHNFDPVPHLKAISKQHIFYLFQTTNNNRIVFYPGVRYQFNSNAIFGAYLIDKQKKSMILGLNRHSIHQLEEEQFAVGYGTEVLLAIGKVDIVLSAFNATNLSYFPVSYRGDQKMGVTKTEDLLGANFTLRQLETYKIL